MAEHDPEDLLSTATDRIERRLAEECGKLRVDMVTQGAAIRMEVAQVRLDLSEQFGASKLNAEAKHRELLKWALVFWIGQAASVAAIVSAFR